MDKGGDYRTFSCKKQYVRQTVYKSNVTRSQKRVVAAAQWCPHFGLVSLWFSYSSFHGPLMAATYSSKHRTTVFGGWNQGQHKGETFFLLLLQLSKKRKNLPEPLSKLLLACHGSEGGHMPTLGLASRYCGRKEEGGNGFWWTTKSKGYKLYKMSRMQPFLSGLASWRQQIAIASVYTSWCSSQSWDAFQHTGIAVEANQEASGFFHSGDVWPFYVASVATLYCWFYHLH